MCQCFGCETVIIAAEHVYQFAHTVFYWFAHGYFSNIVERDNKLIEIDYEAVSGILMMAVLQSYLESSGSLEFSRLNSSFTNQSISHYFSSEYLKESCLVLENVKNVEYLNNDGTLYVAAQKKSFETGDFSFPFDHRRTHSRSFACDNVVEIWD